jgi:hypothetical protein
MINRNIIFSYLPWLLLLITFNSHGQTLQLGNTFLLWIIQFFVLYLFWVIKKKYSSDFHKNQLKVLDYYIFYLFASFCWGSSIATTYWDWKGLIGNTMTLLIPMVAYSMDSKYFFKHLLSSFIYVALPLFIFFQYFIGNDEFGFYLAPYIFILLFLSILPLKWKIISVVITLYVIFADLGARGNVIKFTIPILISILFYFKNIFTTKVLNSIRILFLFLPILLLILGVTGIINIFNPQGENTIELIEKKRNFKGELVEDDLLVDTRTFLYLEVLTSTQKYNSWIFGRSPARGNLSESFGDMDLNRRGERNGNEVGVLNYFTWLGLIGLLFIFLIFYKASYLAINLSNNYFSKLVGVFVSFRWFFSWIEDINIFYIGYIHLWLIVGFCYSITFRSMSDKEMKKWVLSIFTYNLFDVRSRKYQSKTY